MAKQIPKAPRACKQTWNTSESAAVLQYFEDADVFSKMCAFLQSPGHSTLFPVLFFKEYPYTHGYTKPSTYRPNTDGSVSLALIMKITMTVIKKEVEIKSLLSRTFEKKFLMYQEKKIKRDY